MPELLEDKRYKSAKTDLIYLLPSTFLAFGVISVFLNQDNNWDLRNYHFYVGYAFLKSRFFYDFVPAQIQTFHNPFLYLPTYWLIQNLPPKTVGFLLGGIQGINFLLSYIIARTALKDTLSIKRRISLSLLLAVSSTFSPLFLSELGTSFGDNITSLFVLLGVFLILNTILLRKSSATRHSSFIIAGIFLGIAGGLKLPNICFALAALVAITLACEWHDKLWCAIKLLGGIVFGFLISYGYWMFFLFSNYQNPLFPYYNKLFKSPYFGLINFKDVRWTPKSILDGLSYPFAWVAAKNPSSEIAFRDIRWAIAVILLMAIALSFLVRRISPRTLRFPASSEGSHELTEPLARKFIVIYVSVGFIVWLFQFGYSRYLIPLDLISSIYLLCLLEILLSFSSFQQLFSFSGRLNVACTRTFFIAALFATILAVVQVPDWGRASWRSTWFGVERPNITFPDNTIVLMLGSEPMSYVIPFFPSSVKFVRIQGNLFENQELLRGTILQQELEQLVQSHNGSFFTLSPGSSSPASFTTQNVHLKIDKAKCTQVLANNEKFKLCQAFPAS
ncbi:MAG: hypothetical protein ACK5N0_03715 [Synechococcaceae cyanobacterium]